MKKIKIQSPTRVDLAGGTLDLWPLYNFTGGASTINVAMDIQTCAEIEELEGETIELISEDLGFQKKYNSLNDCLRDGDRQLALLKTQIEYWKPGKGFRLITRSESPVGGGLGGSSSLTISLLKAFGKFCDKEFKDVHQMVKVAHNIEAGVLNTPTGTQDYYPAASGGINILNYSVDGITQEVVEQDMDVFSEHILLAYTGKSHHSGINNFEVLTRAVNKDRQTLNALFELKEISTETIAAVKGKKWSQLGELFGREFKARVQLAHAFSSPEIEKLAEVSLQAGAMAVKICGAGGGGCVLIWVAPDRKERVRSACQTAGFQILAAKPVKRIR